ncbi:MAG: RluA family pseudouridine synthase [Eubacteriaceae bacterium]|nr:RluA family pseudouridine synthase [Eubacteriaceae bacterium]
MAHVKMKIIVADSVSPQRVDVYLSERIPKYSRSFLRKIIDDGGLFVNGKQAKASTKIMPQDEIVLYVNEPDEGTVEQQNIALDIVYEDDDLIVVNKAQGMVVHPAAGNRQNTLVNALLYHCKGSLSGIGGVIRPGIVHRLDKDTTGILVAAKNDFTHQKLAQQFKAHSIVRQYYALLHGVIAEEQVLVKAPIGRDGANRKKMAVTEKNAKDAETLFTVLKRYSNHTLVDATLKTGRTHQIRVHAAYLSHPVVGDKTYGYQKKDPALAGQLLHAYKLGLIHPRTDQYMEFVTPFPSRFEGFISKNT